MNILFLTDNFPPEVNAPASRTYDHVSAWRRAGHAVTVITCAPNFPQGKVYVGYKNRWYQEERENGIKIIRVWSYIAANQGFFKRILDFISFSVTSFLAGLFQRADVIVATSPQFFTALSGRTLSFFKRIPWVMEVRDLWPESIKTVGVMQNNVFIRYFEWEEELCYHSAKKIVVVTDSFKKNLIERGVPADKIAVIKNGVNRSLFFPKKRDEQLLEELGLKGKKIIGYIGTHGMAHRLDFILHCAQKWQDKNYHFLFIGAGAEKENLRNIQKILQLNNVTLLDPVSKIEVVRYISILDVALIHLKKSPLFKTVIPSKIFENAAMEVPVLLGVEGEAKEMIEHYGAGLCFEPENESEFQICLSTLLQDEIFYEKCQQGCRLLALDFDRKKLALKMLTVLEQVIH